MTLTVKHCETCECEIPVCPGCGYPQPRSEYACDHCTYWWDR